MLIFEAMFLKIMFHWYYDFRDYSNSNFRQGYFEVPFKD